MHSRIENRTRRETATMLISPTEYVIVENTYEGDVFRIAAELDVDKQVVEDYQNMVLVPFPVTTSLVSRIRV